MSDELSKKIQTNTSEEPISSNRAKVYYDSMNKECTDECIDECAEDMIDDCDCECEGPQRAPKIQKINIEPLDYGFRVKVGCQLFAVESVESLLKKLTLYYNNPKKVEDHWTKNHEFLKK